MSTLKSILNNTKSSNKAKDKNEVKDNNKKVKFDTKFDTKNIDQNDKILPKSNRQSLSFGELMLKYSSNQTVSQQFGKTPIINNNIEHQTTTQIEQSISTQDSTIPENNSIEMGLENEIKFDTKEHKTITVKQTISYFSKEIEKQIENYKAPLMKLQMSLNPKNLGQIGVTMLNRGKNLYIQVHSNENAINMFLQNNNDFKIAFAELGYENIEIKYSSDESPSRDSSEQQKEEAKKQMIENYKNNQKEKNQTTIDIFIPDIIYG
jgi:hypothetical protein